jgi:hypothetical protein
MWLEHLISDELKDVPSGTSTQLTELRSMDRATRDEAETLKKCEALLVEEVQKIGKDQGKDFDEEPFVTRANALIQRRQDLTIKLDDQMKFAQGIYDTIDKRIGKFEIRTEYVSRLMKEGLDSMGGANRKKKKRKADEDDEPGLPTDPNEPVYCFCRRVSWGKMVGCENEECSIEWFHFKCVGISEEPEVWYCETCKAAMGVDQSGPEIKDEENENCDGAVINEGGGLQVQDLDS